MTAQVPPMDLLVVDDDAPTRRYFEIAARGMGLSSRACANTAQALEVLTTHRVKVLVSDLNLGDERAETLAEQLAGWPAPSRPEFILMTGGLTSEVRERFGTWGVRRFWPKPVPLDMLRAELKGHSTSEAVRVDMPEAALVFFKGNRALFERYRLQTLPQLLIDVERADRALSDSDWGALSGVLHNLKTVLQLVGQPAESEAAQRLEQQVHQGAWADCAAGWRHLGQGLRDIVQREAAHG